MSLTSRLKGYLCSILYGKKCSGIRHNYQSYLMRRTLPQHIHSVIYFRKTRYSRQLEYVDCSNQGGNSLFVLLVLYLY
jgi:hypothetical protein